MSATRRQIGYGKVLAAVNQAEHPLTVAEIAERAEVATITVRRHLTRMLAQRVVSRTPRRGQPTALPGGKASGGRPFYQYQGAHPAG